LSTPGGILAAVDVRSQGSGAEFLLHEYVRHFSALTGRSPEQAAALRQTCSCATVISGFARRGEI
jgi:hypothetical protein